MTGYKEDFLGAGILVPHPTFDPELDNQILRGRGLRDGLYSDHPNYTVVMNREERTAAYVALNIDQTSTERWKSELEDYDTWQPDPHFGERHQLDDAYYDIPGFNTYHKGHLARRLSAAHGPDKETAQAANNGTYYYSNRALQHRFYNPDEWLKLEEWARTLDLDATAIGTPGFGANLGDNSNEIDFNHRVCTFSGPIYAAVGRVVRYNDVIPANVPAAFFKIICFRHRETPNELSVRAYIIPQDSLALRDKTGAKLINLRSYQVSTGLIEEVTKLRFAPEIADRNPIYYNPAAHPRTLGVTQFPEVVEIGLDTDIIDPEQNRPAGATKDVRIAAALINPAGRDTGAEWISIANWSTEAVDLAGWTLVDRLDRELPLAGTIEPGQAIRLQPLNPILLSNSAAGTITLRDETGRQMDRVGYTEAEARTEGVPVVFSDPR